MITLSDLLTHLILMPLELAFCIPICMHFCKKAHEKRLGHSFTKEKEETPKIHKI